MTNKGPKDNYTKFPNDMLEALAKTDISREVRVLMAIMRETVGWSTNEKVITAYKISDMTGIGVRNVYLALASLESKKFISRDRNQTGNTIKLLDCGEWSRPAPVSKMTSCQIRHHVKNDTTTSVRSDTTTSVKNDTTDAPVTPDLFGGSESLKTTKDIKDITSLKKSANPKSEKKKATIKNGWAIWVDVCRSFRKPDPLAMGPDTKASALALAALGGDVAALAICYENFLYDEDPYLVKSGHALRDILKRLNLYRSQGKAYFSSTGERISEKAYLEEEARWKKFYEDGQKEIAADEAAYPRMRPAAKDTRKEAEEPNETTKRLLAHINSTVES